MKRTNILILAVLLIATGCGGGGGGTAGQPNSSTAGNSGSDNSGGPGSGASPGGDIIRGTITGFGSVFVDGNRFDTANASVTKDDDESSEDDLNIGMVVELRGDLSAGTATRVDFEEDIKGPVDAVNPDQLTVLGQTVVLTPTTVVDDGLNFGSLNVGDVLEVSGLRGENDALEATFIEDKLLSEVNAFKVIGTLRDLDAVAQSFRIGGLQVDYSIARLDDGVVLADGITVEVKDESLAYSPGDFTLIASKIEPAGFGTGDNGESGDDANTGARGQLEGLITDLVDAGQFELSDVTVRHDANTQFVFGDSSLLSVGTKVQVEGRLNDDRSIDATKIKFSRNSARLHGVVESVDMNNATLTILGLLVDLSQVREYEDDRDDVEPFGLFDIRNGDFLELRGNSTATTLIANEVEREDDDDTRLRGPVAEVDTSARSFSIMGVSINTSANTQYEGLNDERISADAFFAAIADGQALVEAQWEGNVTDPSIAVRELSIED